MPKTTTNQPPSARKNPRLRDRPRVLLAEDTETARLLTSRLLARMGCDVDAVEHGEQALNMARIGHYDVILLDLDMPLMDGAQSAGAIRSLPEHEATPIIAISAFLHAAGQSSDMWRVFDGEIAKPIRLDTLRQMIWKAWPMRSGELGPGGRARADTPMKACS
jgi:CheY-like chemotaxis protein